MPFNIDLRSDTLTKPTAAMRAAMANAEVGDDVCDGDPTVERLQARVADLLGKEAALFTPSGTMANQIAVRIHCKPGDELICDTNCHINQYEQGGAAQLSGVPVRLVAGEYGVLHVDQLRELIRPDDEHFPRTRLVTLENTHNRGGGKVQPVEQVAAISQWAREHGLRMHLDGARLFNAVIASGIPAHVWGEHFDTVSVCFSKGLGAPVGSMLVGTREMIREARRHRKLFGGGMRQVGILAAGALYALDHHIERLREDHTHAQLLADSIRATPGLSLTPDKVDTNIVIFKVDPTIATAVEFVEALDQRGVKMFDFGKYQMRAVTHLDVSREQIEQACEIIRETTAVLRK